MYQFFLCRQKFVETLTLRLNLLQG